MGEHRVSISRLKARLDRSRVIATQGSAHRIGPTAIAPPQFVE